MVFVCTNLQIEYNVEASKILQTYMTYRNGSVDKQEVGDDGRAIEGEKKVIESYFVALKNYFKWITEIVKL